MHYFEQTFLTLDEIGTHEDKSGTSKYNKSKSGTKEDLSISVKNLTVKWDPVCFYSTNLRNKFSICFIFLLKSHLQPTLDHININAKKGDLVCVIGSVGSGKVNYLFLYFIYFIILYLIYRPPF